MERLLVVEKVGLLVDSMALKMESYQAVAMAGLKVECPVSLMGSPLVGDSVLMRAYFEVVY